MNTYRYSYYTHTHTLLLHIIELEYIDEYSQVLILHTHTLLLHIIELEYIDEYSQVLILHTHTHVITTHNRVRIYRGILSGTHTTHTHTLLLHIIELEYIDEYLQILILQSPGGAFRFGTLVSSSQYSTVSSTELCALLASRPESNWYTF